MGTTTGVGFVPTPTQVEEYTHRLTGNKTGTVYTHTHTLDVRSRQPPEPTGSTPEETNRGSGAACYISFERFSKKSQTCKTAKSLLRTRQSCAVVQNVKLKNVLVLVDSDYGLLLF